MKILIIIFFMTLGINANAENCGGITVKDVFPWPWSKQCPFPWEVIEGRWFFREDANPDKMYFEFHVLSQSNFGEDYLMVNLVNKDGSIVAKGIGYSRDESMGVVAAIHYIGQKQTGFWLHISAFVEDNPITKPACTRTNMKTAVKMTSFGKNQDAQAPLVIEKIDVNWTFDNEGQLTF